MIDICISLDKTGKCLASVAFNKCYTCEFNLHLRGEKLELWSCYHTYSAKRNANDQFAFKRRLWRFVCSLVIVLEFWSYVATIYWYRRTFVVCRVLQLAHQQLVACWKSERAPFNWRRFRSIESNIRLCVLYGSLKGTRSQLKEFQHFCSCV